MASFLVQAYHETTNAPQGMNEITITTCQPWLLQRRRAVADALQQLLAEYFNMTRAKIKNLQTVTL